ncbi:zinc finger protein [Macleaya cordata]|uniref:Zinc finger protein n=1 Tax=Macleaya cordata TaxID=56857 RepID=A0A200Q357_MACCD|nr:zinc finger protein [Macleaya cordata]
MVDQIRSKVMILMFDHRESSIGWTSILCPELEKKLEENISAGRTWRVSKSREFVYEVHFERSQSINLSRSSCTCNQWKIQNFPCEHAVYYIQSIGESVYDYIYPYFTPDYFRRSNSHAIEPIPNFDMPRVVSEVATIEPPDTRKGPGRPRVNRIPNTSSSLKRARLYSRCMTYGHHNQLTCAVEI